MRDWDTLPEEIRRHLEDRHRELVANGLGDAAARAAALAEIDDEFSDALRPAEPRHRFWIDMLPDARYTLRGLRRNPMFAAIVVLTLGLGIGANSAIFSIVNAVLLRPLPYDPDGRVVVVWGDLRRPGVNEIPASAGEYVDYRNRSAAFEQIAAYDTDGFNLTGNGEPERVEGAVVSATLFPLLGVSAHAGRTFVAGDEQPGHSDVIVLSHSLWTRRFSADPSLVGRTIALDGKPAMVAGVMPPGFHFPDATTDIWKPILLDADALSDNNRGSHGYTVLALMKKGTTLAQARADLLRVASGFAAEHPNNYRNGFAVTLRPWHDEIVGSTDRPLLLLLGAVGFVLLIACANVANLLLARSFARAREIALRIALGATRGRVVRQLLTESVIIAALGGVAGILIALWTVRAIADFAPAGIPRIHEAAVGWRVLAFTALLTIGTGVIFGIVPALRATMTTDIRRPISGYVLPANLLVIAEVALSFILLAGAGLLVHSFVRLQTVEPGFAPEHLLTFRVSLSPQRYQSFAQGDRFFDRLFAALTTNPPVTSVAAIQSMPFSGGGGSRSFDIEGRQVRRPEDQADEQLRIVSDGYFAAMRIPIVVGREFLRSDAADTNRVAVVNEAFARKFFPSGQAIGHRITFSKAEPRWYEIVGVSANIKHRGLDAPDRPELYVPYKQPLFDSWTVRPMYIVVRSATDPATVVPQIRREIARLDPEQPIADVRTMTDRIAESLAARRFTVMVLAVFAGFALVLATIGLYGVISCAVGQRTREIGVRIALGAQRSDVRRMIVGHGMMLAAIGTILGLAAAATLNRLVASQLYGVSVMDPATFGLVPVALLTATFAACYLPARRATNIEALTALREE